MRSNAPPQGLLRWPASADPHRRNNHQMGHPLTAVGPRHWKWTDLGTTLKRDQEKPREQIKFTQTLPLPAKRSTGTASPGSHHAIHHLWISRMGRMQLHDLFQLRRSATPQGSHNCPQHTPGHPLTRRPTPGKLEIYLYLLQTGPAQADLQDIQQHHAGSMTTMIEQRQTKYSLRKKHQLTTPRYKAKTMKHSIQHRGPVLWNSVAGKCQNAKSGNTKAFLSEAMNTPDFKNFTFNITSAQTANNRKSDFIYF